VLTSKEAKRAYRKAKGNAFRWTFGDRWKITMLGRLSWMIPGNEKVMYKVTRGRNTKFAGRFVVYRFGRSYSLLKYNKPENSWWVRRIRDRVRFVDESLAVGRFYWGGIFLGWFTMERVDNAQEEVEGG